MLNSEVNHRVLPLFKVQDAALVLIVGALGAAFFNSLFWTVFRSVTVGYHKPASKSDFPFVVITKDVSAAHPYLYSIGFLVFGLITLTACVFYRAVKLRRDAHLYADGLTARVENRWRDSKAAEERRKIELAATYIRRNTEVQRQYQAELAAHRASVHQLEMDVVRAYPLFLAKLDPSGRNPHDFNEQAFRNALLSGRLGITDPGLLREATDAQVLKLVGDRSRLPRPMAKIPAPVYLEPPSELAPYI